VFTYTKDSAELQRRAAIVIDAIRAGWLRKDQGTAYDLDRVADAHRAIEGRGTREAVPDTLSDERRLSGSAWATSAPNEAC
jgi:hypothetical protein